MKSEVLKIIRETDSKRMEQTAQCLRARDYANWNGNFTGDGKVRCLSAGAHSGSLHSDMTWLTKEPNIQYIKKDKTQHSRVYNTEGISPTLTGASKLSGDCTPKIKEKMKIRRLTPIECERLQGFPDGWTEGISDSQRYKCLGNAVTVNVIKAIMEKLFNRSCLDEIS